MFGWWTRAKRKRWLSTAEPRELRNILRGDIWQWQYLPDDVEEAAIDWLRTFEHEKYWEGCGGFQLDSYHHWIVAGQASLMSLAFPDWFFDGCKSLLIYPGNYVAPGITHMVDGQIGIHGQQPRSGQTSYRGPVILNWPAIHSAAQDNNAGHSITVHELAHQLDFDNGPGADGLPPLPTHVDPVTWHKQFQSQLETLRDHTEHGREVLVDDYGLTSLSEFFAVTSELFFQLPHHLAEWHPELFELILTVYGRDFREWLP